MNLTKLIALSFFTALTVFAADRTVSVSWTDPNPPSMGVTGYRIYYATIVGTTTNLATNVVSVVAPQTSTTIAGIHNGQTYSFWGTCVNAFGESEPGGHVPFQMPIGLNVTVSVLLSFDATKVK